MDRIDEPVRKTQLERFSCPLVKNASHATWALSPTTSIFLLTRVRTRAAVEWSGAIVGAIADVEQAFRALSRPHSLALVCLLIADLDGCLDPDGDATARR